MAPADPEVALIASGSEEEEEEGRPAPAASGFWGWRGLVVAGLSAAILGASVSVEGCGPGGGGGGGGGVLTLDGNISFAYIADQGGLITSLKFGGTPILVESPLSDAHDGYGSTFWPAPKSSWHGSWPPPAEIALGTYDVNATNDSVLLTSKPDEAAGIQVQKLLTVDTERLALILKYTVTGLNETEVSYAGWETTYVPGGGLTFWKTGTPVPVYEGFGEPHMEEIDGITYVDHSDANVTEGGVKVSMKSEGAWMAHATNETVFIKVFQAITESDVAPGEGNIALFALPTFATMEIQGALTPTTNSTPFTYVVCWYVRELPDDARPLPGDERLLALVNDVAELGCPEE